MAEQPKGVTKRKNQKSNEFGIIRKEGVFSVIDFVDQVNDASGPHGDIHETLVLKLAKDVDQASDRNVAINLVNDIGCAVSIPAGSLIQKVVVSKATGNNAPLDKDLSFALGYLSCFVKDEGRKAQLAQRVANKDKPITGNLLNRHVSIAFGDVLGGDKNAKVNEIYDEEEESQKINANVVDSSVVAGCVAVGERYSIVPALTVLSGSLKASNLVVTIVYAKPVETC